MLTDAEFAFVAREVKARSGALITREMSGAAETWLSPLARREGYGSVSEFLNAARTRQDGKLIAAIADALVSAETRFFRDKPSFERLKTDLLRAVAKRGDQRLRIWSAGCATGQEAYSIAMIIDAMKAEGFAGAEILGTDFSQRLLDKARSGLYTQFEVQRGLPIRKLIQHFEKASDLWRISDRLRGSVRFEQHNLLESAANLGQFDIVFCCNVLSSFDPATREATLERLGDALVPDGVLVLGASEKLPEGVDGFGLEGGVITRRAA